MIENKKIFEEKIAGSLGKKALATGIQESDRNSVEFPENR